MKKQTKITMVVLLLVLALSGNVYSQLKFPDSETTEYDAWLLNTGFVVPIVRFNSVSNDVTKKGDVSLFNSIGAGIGIGWGSLEVTADKEGDAINSTMHNIIGLQAGFLFSADTNKDATNIFALTAGLTVLDFQLGYGYEFGTVKDNQKRGFITIAYSIPLSKLIRGGFYVFKATKKASKDKGDDKRNFFP